MWWELYPPRGIRGFSLELRLLFHSRAPSDTFQPGPRSALLPKHNLFHIVRTPESTTHIAEQPQRLSAVRRGLKEALTSKGRGFVFRGDLMSAEVMCYGSTWSEDGLPQCRHHILNISRWSHRECISRRCQTGETARETADLPLIITVMNGHCFSLGGTSCKFSAPTRRQIPQKYQPRVWARPSEGRGISQTEAQAREGMFHSLTQGRAQRLMYSRLLFQPACGRIEYLDFWAPDDFQWPVPKCWFKADRTVSSKAAFTAVSLTRAEFLLTLSFICPIPAVDLIDIQTRISIILWSRYIFWRAPLHQKPAALRASHDLRQCCLVQLKDNLKQLDILTFG